MNMSRGIWIGVALCGAVACSSDSDDDPTEETSGSGGSSFDIGGLPPQTGGRSFSGAGGGSMVATGGSINSSGGARNTGGTSASTGGTPSGGTSNTSGGTSNTGGNQTTGGSGGTITCGMQLDGTACPIEGAYCAWRAAGDSGSCRCEADGWSCTKTTTCPAPRDAKCGSPCTGQYPTCVCERSNVDLTSCSCTGSVWTCPGD